MNTHTSAAVVRLYLGSLELCYFKVFAQSVLLLTGEIWYLKFTGKKGPKAKQEAQLSLG